MEIIADAEKKHKKIDPLPFKTGDQMSTSDHHDDDDIHDQKNDELQVSSPDIENNKSGDAPSLNTVEGLIHYIKSVVFKNKDKTPELSRFKKLINLTDFHNLPKGRSYILGSSVSASVGSNAAEDNWLVQPLRSGRKGVGSEKESPITVLVNQDYTELLKNSPLKDIRLGYDGLFKWILKQDHDLVLFCACAEDDFTWVTEIIYQNNEIVSIKERKLHEQNHAIFDTELTELIEDVVDRFPEFEIILSASDITVPSHLGFYRNIGDEPFSYASGIVDFGHFRITKLTILPMITAVLAMLMYVGIFMYNLNVEMNEREEKFGETLRGIESEYEKGGSYLKLLQSQKALIRSESDYIEPMHKVRLILSSLSSIDGLLLNSISVKDMDDDYREATLDIIMMPVANLSSPEQIVPVVNKLAADIGLQVGVERAGERNINSLSNNSALTVATLIIKIPKE